MVHCACGHTFQDDGTLGRHRSNCQAAHKQTLDLVGKQEEAVKRRKAEKNMLLVEVSIKFWVLQLGSNHWLCTGWRNPYGSWGASDWANSNSKSSRGATNLVWSSHIPARLLSQFCAIIPHSCPPCSQTCARSHPTCRHSLPIPIPFSTYTWTCLILNRMW